MSQFGKKDKDLLKKHIESHGGEYLGALDMERTAILIVTTAEVVSGQFLDKFYQIWSQDQDFVTRFGRI